MIVMIFGLLLFLGTHSARIFAEEWRATQIKKRGQVWFVAYALTSLVGIALVAWGYGMARGEAPVLWVAPVWMKHVAALFIVPGFILMLAVALSGTKIKATLGHPMVVGTILWAFGHLLVNGSLADAILFGSILVWATLNFRAARHRDKARSIKRVFEGYHRDLRAMVIGLVLSFLFVIYVHSWLIGVTPFP